MTGGAWFPRPASAEDIALLPPLRGWCRSTLFDLLTRDDAVEWRNRVGVAGREDGSGKLTTRLLASAGWILKTRTDLARPELSATVEETYRLRAPGLEAGVWHPLKQWFALRDQGEWYPITVCPRLDTLRRDSPPAERAKSWLRMYELALAVHERSGLGLDINPSNFGTCGESSTLWYIDDEFYPALTETELAGAVVARIPEEPQVTEDEWAEWGDELYWLVKTSGAGIDLPRLEEAMEGYPLAERFDPARRGIVARLRSNRAAEYRSKRSRRAPITCVIADVHGNRQALLAVLEEAAKANVDRFLFVGDAVGYGPRPRECIEILAALPNATLVRGNHDHAIAYRRLHVGMNRLARRCAEWTLEIVSDSEREWLGKLPTEHCEEDWLAVHGAPKDPHKFLAYVYELTYEDNLRHMRRESMPLCFYGHTHVQLAHAELPSGPQKLTGVDELSLARHRPILVNPGSVGQPRDGDWRAAFALWHRQDERVTFHRVGYDVDGTIRDVQNRGLPQELCARLRGGN